MPKLPHALAAALFIATSLAAQAQTAPSASSPASGVKVSTDPARAASVERAAAQLRARPPQPPVGLVRTQTAAGYALLSGGVTAGDRATMQAERQPYSLWVATVAKPSGAYLADAELRITDTKTKKPVLERKMEGPWLMVALPPGPYEVMAVFRDTGAEKAMSQTTRVTISAKGQRQAVLRFDSKATVDPEMQNTENNPFGAAKPRK